MDLPLGPASFVLVVYEAVQGYCRPCGHYETVRPLQIVEQHTATLRLMRQREPALPLAAGAECLRTGAGAADDGLPLRPLHPPNRAAGAAARWTGGLAH